MYSNLAKIKDDGLEKGMGQALYDNPDNPTKRYFLEKRWKSEGEILGVIMVNPSKAGALESDNTVTALMNMAKRRDYAALYIVNIIPYIDSSVLTLNATKLDLNSMVTEDNQLKGFDLLFQGADTILMAWGEYGHKRLPLLMKSNHIRELFEHKKSICKVIGFGRRDNFPYHPLPVGRDKYKLNEVELLDASEQVQEWVNKYK